MLEHAAAVNAESQCAVETIDEALFRQLASQSSGDLMPINSVIGGFSAQEVMKACSGKFSPLRQHMYFDSLESLPEDGTVISPESCQPVGDRYDGQRAVFGSEFQKTLGALR
jgi:ubiquitin-activating enzyme E1